MNHEALPKEESKKLFEKIQEDLFAPLSNHYGLTAWLVGLFTVLITAGMAYFYQLRDGLGVTNMGDIVSWGLYISTFVFFVAVSLVGMLISAVMGLLNIKGITPVTRIAELIAIAFVMMAGNIIIFDMGRPDRLLNVFLHGRIQSPIVWDITVITTYITISLLLLIFPLIPDMAIMQNKIKNASKLQLKIYKILSFGYVGLPAQKKLIHKSIRMLSVLIIPVAFGIHTVTSWLFAMTPRVGWDSTIFGPYFVAGAFPAGVGAMAIAMYIFRNNYNLKDYITEKHFDFMGKLLVLTSVFYLYFNINEFLVPGYKMKAADGHHIEMLFAGKYAVMFWMTQIFGLFIPIIVLLFKKGRKPRSMLVMGFFVVIGAFFKRFIIVVPTMIHPHLPVQNVPYEFTVYFPNGFEWAIVMGAISIALLIITLLAKLVPIMPVWEIAEEKGVREEDIIEAYKSNSEN